MATDLSDEILERALTGRFGRYRRVYDSIDSTNLEALRWVTEEGAPQGSLVVADTQTAGRGRWGRSWLAEPGRGLLFSLVLRPEESSDPRLVTTVVGLATAQGIERAAGLPVEIKWPNDVVVSGRKVSGILVESRIAGEGEPAGSPVLIAGVGVNVHGVRDDFPSATSIAAEAEGRVPARAELLAAILLELEDLYGMLDSPDGTNDLVRRATERSAVIGKRVKVAFADGRSTEGKATGIAPDGGLILDDHQTITAGEIERLRPSP